MHYVMPVEVLVTLNVITVKLKRKQLGLFDPAKDLIVYLYGLPEFDLVTDHQDLKTIHGPPLEPSARIEHWVHSSTKFVM